MPTSILCVVACRCEKFPFNNWVATSKSSAKNKNKTTHQKTKNIYYSNLSATGDIDSLFFMLTISLQVVSKHLILTVPVLHCYKRYNKEMSTVIFEGKLHHKAPHQHHHGCGLKLTLQEHRPLCSSSRCFGRFFSSTALHPPSLSLISFISLQGLT